NLKLVQEITQPSRRTLGVARLIATVAKAESRTVIRNHTCEPGDLRLNPCPLSRHAGEPSFENDHGISRALVACVEAEPAHVHQLSDRRKLPPVARGGEALIKCACRRQSRRNSSETEHRPGSCP